jgi:hypothetical protein
MDHSPKIAEMCPMEILRPWLLVRSILNSYQLVGYRKWGLSRQVGSLLAKMLNRIIINSLITTNLRWKWEAILIITLPLKALHQKPTISIVLRDQIGEIQT